MWGGGAAAAAGVGPHWDQLSDMANSSFNLNDLVNNPNFNFLNSTVKNSTSLSLLSLNIQSLPSKYHDLLELITELSIKNCSPDFICLQETWLVVDANLYPLPGFQPIIFSSRTHGRGGGVGIYVKTGFSFKKCQLKSIFIDSLFESLFINVSLPTGRNLLLVLYTGPTLNSKILLLTSSLITLMKPFSKFFLKLVL